MNPRTPAKGGRRPVRLASAAAAALVAGLLAGNGSAAGEGGTPATLSYDCGLPSGSGRATVEVAMNLPASAEAGKPVQPGPVKVTVGLARGDLAALLPKDTDAVLSTGSLAVKVSQNDQSATAMWSDLAAPSTPVPAEGDVRLVHSGPVPTVTVGGTGDVTLAAGELKLGLLTATPGTGQQGAPEPVPLVCEPAAGQDLRLGTVPVPGAGSTGPATSPGSPGASTPAGGKGRKDADGGVTVQPRSDPAPVGKCPTVIPKGKVDISDAPVAPPGATPGEYDLPGSPGCAYALGVANVSKLNGAMIINDPKRKPVTISVLAVVHSSVRSSVQPGGLYLRLDSLADLRLPDAESTFLTFGFQPVTAKVHFETGPVTISTGNVGTSVFSVISFKQSLRLYDVKVNGTPLDVGSACRTATPYKVVLNGGAKYTNVFYGGTLDGTIDIPKFSGCGANGEDLDPLFTASLSGPGNSIEMNQGTTCIPDSPNNLCPPDMPELPGSGTSKP
ncbi:DUF6801 domain-containing protein [Streptomyces sp. NBC_01306]|uniref:DUF6801 domain-containing protein n=1 Tax=Streptomyces sp. NBC_01306 TaxID=2903819 RepID=UPI00225BEC71|nr:DUF6801 domain-containing protein [Streptomyces sp. NBC_01306]MCX4722647.1 hypothetical protein [Streptomyces sp. NBC_01306]